MATSLRQRMNGFAKLDKTDPGPGTAKEAREGRAGESRSRLYGSNTASQMAGNSEWEPVKNRATGLSIGHH